MCRLIECFGFEFAREKGSHRIYKTRLINLQPGKNGKAKPYQVKQVLKIIEERYGC
ncbi:type II toxin-antitoxin system HicA family toxin [Rhodothermus marinus]|uniref:type II toxin-antitoxin system HicA family toxin n=1 Tax=Rhodothermus marinus TaxID=29549 RepID=UPI000309EE1E